MTESPQEAVRIPPWCVVLSGTYFFFNCPNLIWVAVGEGEGLKKISSMHMKDNIGLRFQDGLISVCSFLQGIEVVWTGGNCSREVSRRMGQRN